MLWAAAILASAAAPTPLAIHLHIRVALCPGPDGTAAPTRPSAWVDEHLAGVQAVLGPHGIAVTSERDDFTPPHCEILSRADRDDFASQVPAAEGTITVLVVPLVRDLRVPSYNLRGVHWRAGKKEWIFLTARARPPTLAHELGHHFGLPHDPAGGNLMTPGPSSPAWQSAHPPRPFAPLLEPQQVRRLRAGIVRRRGHAP
jgi:hypothetical protein